MVILNIIDSIAWLMVRIIGLIQALIGEFILIFYQPNPCKKSEYKHFNILMSLTFGGWMLFQSSKKEDLPSFMSGRMLNYGRFLLGVFIISGIQDILRLLL